jgi:hypothetical protein
MADNDLKKIYESIGKYPAKGMRELDVEKGDTSRLLEKDTSKFLERRKMLASPSTKDIASALIKSSPIGRGARAIKGALKATGLMGAGYAANEAEDMIKEKIEKKKTGGAVFIPRGQKMFQVNKQKSRIV